MGRRKHRLPRHLREQSRPPQVQALSSLDMGFINAAKLKLVEWKSVEIVIAGCGGNGSFMAMHAARLMRTLHRSGKGAHLTLIDPDVVEEGNVDRQLFCDAEIDRPKAACLAQRYGFAWGVNTSYAVDKYDEKYLVGADLTLLIGCVDNAEARKALNATLQNNVDQLPFPPSYWWLDCGNLRDTGRVLLGSAHNYDSLRSAFPEPRECAALPSPALQYPDLLRPRPEEIEDLSCAEMLQANMQSLVINSRIAAEAADFVARTLITEDLRRFACEINTAAGSVKSTYISPDEVARVIGKPVSFVIQRQAA